MEKMEKEKVVMDFLTDQQNYYLAGNNTIQFYDVEKIYPFDAVLYRIDEISFEDKAPRKEALENVLSSMKMDGINFIYLILGDSSEVHFYYGVAKNYNCKDKTKPELNIADIGKCILEPSIKGNFRGSKITEICGVEKRKILSEIMDQKYYSMLEGVPGYVQDDEKFQGVDRLVDVMLGDRFGFMIIASPVNYDDLREIESNLYDLYSKIVPLSKESVQEGKTTNSGESEGKTDSENESWGKSYSKSYNESINISDGSTHTEGTGDSKSVNLGTSVTENGSSKSNGRNKSGTEGVSTNKSDSRSHNEATTTGGGNTEGKSSSKGTGKSTSIQKSRGQSMSNSKTVEFVNKKAQDWLKYLDEVIIPRLDYGNGKGVFLTTSFLV